MSRARRQIMYVGEGTGVSVWGWGERTNVHLGDERLRRTMRGPTAVSGPAPAPPPRSSRSALCMSTSRIFETVEGEGQAHLVIPQNLHDVRQARQLAQHRREPPQHSPLVLSSRVSSHAGWCAWTHRHRSCARVLSSTIRATKAASPPAVIISTSAPVHTYPTPPHQSLTRA